MNGNFERKYGLTWKDMDNDARMQAIMSEIFDLSEKISPLSNACKSVERHKLYFTIIWSIITLLGIPTILMFISWVVQR